MTSHTTDAPPMTRSPGTSLHRQLFVVLRDEIGRGVYAASGALPKEETLCVRFGVSRITVRRALTDLAALGLVERRHGLGTFVRSGVSAAPAGPTLTLIDSLKQTAAQTEVEVLEVRHAAVPADLGRLLQLPPQASAVHARRLRLAGSAPVMLTDAWVPEALGRGVTAAALKKRALYEILQQQGVVFGRVLQEISAQLADPARAAWLRVEVGSPLLKLVRLMHDRDDRPVQHLTAYLPPERSRILMDISGESVNTLAAGQIVYDPPSATASASSVPTTSRPPGRPRAGGPLSMP